MNSRFSSLSDNLGIYLPPVLKLEMHFFLEVVCAFIYTRVWENGEEWDSIYDQICPYYVEVEYFED